MSEQVFVVVLAFKVTAKDEEDATAQAHFAAQMLVPIASGRGEGQPAIFLQVKPETAHVATGQSPLFKEQKHDG